MLEFFACPSRTSSLLRPILHALSATRDLLQVKPLSTLVEPCGIIGRVGLTEFVSLASDATYGIRSNPADKGATEPSNLLVDGAYIEEDAIRPKLLDEALTREDRSRRRNQECQQFELDLTQANEPTGAVYCPARWIDPNTANDDCGWQDSGCGWNRVRRRGLFGTRSLGACAGRRRPDGLRAHD